MDGQWLKWRLAVLVQVFALPHFATGSFLIRGLNIADDKEKPEEK